MSEWQEIDGSIIKTFRDETSEILADLEAALLSLEGRPGDAEVINRVFRSLHTIKGSSSMLGIDRISSFAHQLEGVFDLVRSGKMDVTAELINHTLSARDLISAMIAGLESGEDVDEGRMRGLLKELEGLPGAGCAQTGGCIGGDAAKGQPATFRIRFHPARDILRRGVNPTLLFRSLSTLGQCRIIAQQDEIPPLEEMDPEQCYVYWDIILTTDRGENAIRDVFACAEDDSEIRLEMIDGEGRISDEASYKRLGDILVERGDLSPGDVRKVIREQKKIGEMLVEAGVVDQGKVYSALVEQEHIRSLRKKQEMAEKATSIRVASEKLDGLVDLVGELVTVQARLTRASLMRSDPELILIAETVERLTADLRTRAMGIRMVPIGSLYSRLRRLVRDLSSELGKEVELLTFGAETELDKTLIEKLHDPLIHLIRNAIDHGIEPPQLRKAAGKPPRGSIHLSAVHSGPSVVIQISDDGGGIDHEAIRKRAAEKGLISRDAELAEKDIFNLLFAPGFSTAQDVTSVSGRGVGMDIVKKGVEAFRGTIDIGSQKGRGTTVMLSLPLTLAIIEGLLVKVGSAFFVIPLHLVEECVELTREDLRRAHGRALVRVRDRIVPYIRLRQQFSLNGPLPDIEQVVIVSVEEGKFGFVVDQVVGEHQTVIKSLGRFYSAIRGLSGATILGDGTVALILNVPQLVRSAVKEEL